MTQKETETAKRIQREAEFHNALMHKSRSDAGFYEFGANQHAVQRLYDLLGDLPGKKILDFGCGCGWISVDLARRGATVDAFDISEESIKSGEQYATKMGVSDRIHFRKSNAEATDYEDNAFDIVVGGGILHHLDLEAAFRELHRVLRPGGKAYFLEPLGHNPIINLYRRLTPNMRTPDEHPLSIPQIRASTRRFRHLRCEYFYFLALLAFPFMIMLKRPLLFQKSLDVLCRADDYLLPRFPCVRRFCWSTIIILEK